MAVYTAMDEGSRLEIWNLGNGKNLLYMHGNKGADQQCSCSSVISVFMFALQESDFLTIQLMISITAGYRWYNIVHFHG